MTLMIRQPSTTLQTTSEGDNPYTPGRFEIMMNYAKALHAGGLMKDAKSPEAVFSLMLLCDAQGVHLGNAIMWFNIIKGKPSMTAAAMQGKFQAAGGKVRWGVHNREKVEAWFSHPQLQPEEYYVCFELQEMIKTGVAMTWDDLTRQQQLKENWAKWPEDMLSSRVVSRGVRRIAPGLVLGIYTPEEIDDMTNDKDAPTLTVSASSPPPAPTPPKPAKPVPATEPAGGVDVALPGQPAGKHDARPFAEVVKGTVGAINDEADVVLGVPPITNVKAALAAIKRDLESSKVIEQGTTYKGEGEAMKALTLLYRDNRDAMRTSLNTFVDEVYKTEAKRLKTLAETQPAPAQREPGEDG